ASAAVGRNASQMTRGSEASSRGGTKAESPRNLQAAQIGVSPCLLFCAHFGRSEDCTRGCHTPPMPSITRACLAFISCNESQLRRKPLGAKNKHLYPRHIPAAGA